MDKWIETPQGAGLGSGVYYYHKKYTHKSNIITVLTLLFALNFSFFVVFVGEAQKYFLPPGHRIPSICYWLNSFARQIS